MPPSGIACTCLIKGANDTTLPWACNDTHLLWEQRVGGSSPSGQLVESRIVIPVAELLGRGSKAVIQRIANPWGIRIFRWT